MDEFTEKHGDYIHASWVSGFDRVDQYIVAQAPFNEGTEFDFWRMIWQQWPSVVVLLTPLVGVKNAMYDNDWLIVAVDVFSWFWIWITGTAAIFGQQPEKTSHMLTGVYMFERMSHDWVSKVTCMTLVYVSHPLVLFYKQYFLNFECTTRFR